MDNATTLERVTLTIPKPLLERIDEQRDLAPRSPFVCRILAKALAQQEQPDKDMEARA